MRTVTVSTELAAPASGVWAAVKTPQAFVHVAHPMLRFPAAATLDRPWRVGDVVEGWTWLAGFVPFSRHTIAIASIDDEHQTMRSEEHGGLIRTWHHDIVIEPTDERTCRYTDRIVIDAGPLTLAVVGFAHLFYRHRQRRWRRLAPVLGAQSGSD